MTTKSKKQLPEEFTAVDVIRIVDGLFQDAAEVKRQPAESKDHHETEDSFSHFPTLKNKTNSNFMSQKQSYIAQHAEKCLPQYDAQL